MLRTTIQTTDKEGKELPIPADLLAKVRRAADILATMLHKVGEKLDIVAHWWFDPVPGKGLTAFLLLTLANRAVRYEFPDQELWSDDSIRHWLWKPIDKFIPVLSEEVDRMLADIRRDLAALATTAGE
jgi:hypothetical protein